MITIVYLTASAGEIGGGDLMKVEVGTYDHPGEVGYKGWVALEKYVAFESLGGQVTVIKRPDSSEL